MTATPSAGSSPWTRTHRTSGGSTLKPSGPIASFVGHAMRSSHGPTTPTPGTSSVKRSAPRRRESGEQHRDRNSYWSAASAKIHEEHPEYNKAEVRSQVRARILALVDQFTADIQGSSDTDRARIMAVFRQWDEDTVKSALDPDWSSSVSPNGRPKLRPPWSSTTYAARLAARRWWTTSTG